MADEDRICKKTVEKRDENDKVQELMDRIERSVPGELGSIDDWICLEIIDLHGLGKNDDGKMNSVGGGRRVEGRKSVIRPKMAWMAVTSSE